MSYLYNVFGLTLRFNVEIAGLCVPLTEATWDIDISLGMAPQWLAEVLDAQTNLRYISSYIETNQRPSLKVWTLGDTTQYIRFLYADDTEFIIDQGGSKIWARWSDGFTLEDTLAYLLGPIIGFVMRLRNRVVLHASAIAVDNQAIALFGLGGRGKSTTAAAFAKLGLPILTDDIVALVREKGKLFVQPAYPRLRLWPESSEILFGSRTALPAISSTWDKLYLDLNQEPYQFQGQPLPLTAVYLLGERSDTQNAPFIEAVSPRDSIMDLVANSTINYVQDTQMRAREFETFGFIIDTLPVRRVTPHTDPSLLSKLCATILDDFRAIHHK
jgi:hypothetical protein